MVTILRVLDIRATVSNFLLPVCSSEIALTCLESYSFLLPWLS